MGNVKILDCTLRDGGYVNDWGFGKNNIRSMISNMVSAHIDIIETGFIRDVSHNEDSAVFSSMEQIAEMIHPKKTGIIYAVMIEQRNFNNRLISKYDGLSVDVIRLTFRKNEWAEAKETAKILMEKGYKVCVQPVGTATYDDKALLNLINEVNELNPYAFYLVDTLGMMYMRDMRRFFYLIDNNLSPNICLGFHSHNNLQMSFSNAQEMVRLNTDRTIIIDTSCYGMGRGVGNLATELFADYINKNVEHKYSLAPILNIVDKFLMPIYAKKRWGYDLPYFLSAIAECHPNYAAHLMKKETLSIESIEHLLSLLPAKERSEYNSGLIEQLYVDMQSSYVDDKKSYELLRECIANKDVLILGSGSSIVSNKKEIVSKIKSNELYVISINFVPEEIEVNSLFIANEKRLNVIDSESAVPVLATSNLKEKIKGDVMFFNYASLLGEGDASDNAGAMLIRILKNININRLYIAGLDGFNVNSSINYAVDTFKHALDYDAAKKKNEDISRQLKLALNGVCYELLTCTKYEI